MMNFQGRSKVSTRLWSFKEISTLSQRKVREETNCILVEGKHPIEEALKAKLPLEQAFILKGCSLENLPTEPWPFPPQEVDSKTMGRLADTNTSPPCLAVFTQPKARLAENLKEHTGLIVVLDEIQDPGNLGTILRSSVAFGASAIVLLGNTVDAYSPKVIRASAGIQFSFPLYKMQHKTFIELVNNDNATVYVTSSHTENIPHQTLQTIQFQNPSYLVLGNEGKGIDRDFIAALSNVQYLTIPTDSRVESLNVAICGSIILAFAATQKQNLSNAGNGQS